MIRMSLLKLLSAQPPPTASITRISFPPILPEYHGLYAVVIDNLFTPAECSALVHAAEASSVRDSPTDRPAWEPAMINVGGGRQEYIPGVRSCGRIMWDDENVVDAILTRVRKFVPELEVLVAKEWAHVVGNGAVKRAEVHRLTRLNERMRFLKYGPGHYFQAHCDGSYVTPSNRERSYFTLHMYLNDDTSVDAEGPLEGGATTFHSMNMKEKMDVVPKVGRVLIFQHAYLLHSGEEVRKGLKFTMRTDLMYEKVTTESTVP